MDIRKILSIQKNVDIQANLPDGVIFTATSGIIQWANDIAHDLFRVELNQLISKSVNDLLENGYDLIVNSANTHKALIAKYTQGEEYFEITAREIEGGYVVALRDSTQNYKRISNILEEQETSQKVNSDKNTFLVKLANEFNSPIQSIIGFAQGLLDGLGGQVSDKQAKYVNIIKKNSSELLYFFNKLVELSQSEGNLIESEEKYFDIVTTLDNIVKANKHLNSEKAVNIHYEVNPDFKKMVYQSETAFKLMMQNLIETVMREIDLGNIYVTLSDADEDFLTARNIPINSSLLITISSTNISVLETDLPTLFNPYATIEKANKRTISRALALGTVANIAKDLGGVIWAENVPMKGFVFSIVIPREKAHNE
ncbi:MAG: PAS domain-containing protein [Candidatus Gastranaerophilales bacterium]|nr:PAS domain-containing protein [Candidatus Gastranaerophilales bacterium]